VIDGIHTKEAGRGRRPASEFTFASARRKPHAPSLQAKLPSKATLVRRWPRLKVNRLTGRWVDDATGARGEDIQSLLVFLNERGGAR
jgi:hypothetical protein